MPNTSDFIQEDGFGTIVTIDGVADLKFEEVETQPPGYEGGGAINTTTHRNGPSVGIKLRTNAPKKTTGIGNIALKVVYKTACDPVIRGLLKVVKLYTLTYPDGATMQLWAWLDDFKPGSNKDQEQPTADILIIPALRNPTTGLVVAPIYTPGPALP
jgi:hypothetical protein